MSFTENQGTKIYWDEQGSGDPILLIMGLGYASNMWHRSRPLLTAQYRTIAFDNRGIGRSDVPPGPYSLSVMASDAAAVLDAAGVDRAHVFGVSMGGMIAQEFALQYPQRVRSLVLGCTASGGPQAVRTEPDAVQALTRRGLTPTDTFETVIPFIYDPATPRNLIDEDRAHRLEWYPTPEGYMAQLMAIFEWEAYSRISQITAPTLVIHGETDRLVPAGNANLIAARIPNAKLVLLPQASHIFATDQPSATHQAILDFLSTQSNHKQTAHP